MLGKKREAGSTGTAGTATKVDMAPSPGVFQALLSPAVKPRVVPAWGHEDPQWPVRVSADGYMSKLGKLTSPDQVYT